MSVLTLNWQTVHKLQDNRQLDELLQKYSALFIDELGKLEGIKVKLHVDTKAHPKFCKARPVPLALPVYRLDIHRCLVYHVTMFLKFSEKLLG